MYRRFEKVLSTQCIADAKSEFSNRKNNFFENLSPGRPRTLAFLGGFDGRPGGPAGRRREEKIRRRERFASKSILREVSTFLDVIHLNYVEN